MDVHATAMSDTMELTSAISVARRYIQALAERDFSGLESLFDTDVRFRALVPRGLREASTASMAAGWLRSWFSEADAIELIESEVSVMADRIFLRYRLRVDGAGRTTLIEQLGFVDVTEGHIDDLSLICSGFRPALGATCSIVPDRSRPRARTSPT